jgi:hypothetical protein
MQTVKWGPGLWIGLHCMTFNYPDTPSQIDKNHYKTFFESLQFMLPCVYCRDSYTIYIKYLPINNFLDDRYGVTYWLYRLHNLVNQKLQKPMVDFIDCCIMYEKMRAKCGKVLENDVKYLECVKKASDIKRDNVENFVQIAEQKYKAIADDCVLKLLSSEDNPNKECNVCKHKLYYDRY